MGTQWTPAAEVQAVAERIIPIQHPHLKRNFVEVKYRFRDDLPMSGGVVLPGKVEKVGVKMALDLAEAAGKLPDFDMDPIDVQDDDEAEGLEASGGDIGAIRPYYWLWVSKPVWSGLDAKQQEALVDHLLCSTESSRNEKSGELVLKKRAPDWNIYVRNVERYGGTLDGIREVAVALAKAGQQTLPLLNETVVPNIPQVNAGGETVPAALAESAMRAAGLANERTPLVIVEGGSHHEGVQAEEDPAQAQNDSREMLTEAPVEVELQPQGGVFTVPDISDPVSVVSEVFDGVPDRNSETCQEDYAGTGASNVNGNGKHAGQVPGVEGFDKHRRKKKAEQQAESAA